MAIHKTLIFIVISGLMVSTGCTTLKRYSSMADPAVNNTIADVNLFGISLSSPEPGKNSRSLWDLSADAQSQFIKILNTRFPDNSMFLNSFNLEYMKESDESSLNNYINKDLRLVFSVSKMRKIPAGILLPGIDISPADRLEYIRISLRIPEDSILKFRSWNKFATEYGSVDIADVSFSRTIQLSTSGSYDNGKAGGAFSANTASNVNRKEDQSLKQRYLLLNGRIDERKIEMEEEGTRETDLTGNIIADVSLGFNSFPETLTTFSGLKNIMGEFNDPSGVRVEYSVVSVPRMREIKDTIKGELQMEYVYRNVVRGSKTFPEWDDRIKYYSGNVKKIIPLFTSHEYVPDFYCIGTDIPVRELLKIRVSDNNLSCLKFRSYNEAVDFYSWLLQYMAREGSATNLKIEGQPLLFKDNNLISVQVRDPNFRVLPYYR